MGIPLKASFHAGFGGFAGLTIYDSSVLIYTVFDKLKNSDLY
jgi:hypothetical protein